MEINIEKDIKYKELLAKSTGCSLESLSSIVGKEEFIDIIKRLAPVQYLTGNVFGKNFNELFSNVINSYYRANLHIHTTASDGYFNVQDMLNQAAAYADKVASAVDDGLPPFIVAVTNHDNIDDSKKAVKILSENPDKYKNLKVVLGCEFSALYENSSILKTPLKTDYLAYCINPFDKCLNEFIDSYVSKRFNITKEIVKKLNHRGLKITYDEVLNIHLVIKCGGSTAFFDLMRRQFNKMNKENNSNIEFEDLLNGKQEETTPYIEEIVNLIDNNNGGVSGVAHPARINLNNIINKEFFYGIEYEDFYKYVIKVFLKDVYSCGARVIEGNYQYNSSYYLKNLCLRENIPVINEIASLQGFLNTGGTDAHRQNIFTHHQDLTQEQIDILLSY